MTSLATLSGVDFSYGQLQVLFGVDLEVRTGEVLGLLGTNGAGKSTVLRVLSGLSPATRGTVTFRGEDVSRVPAEDLVPRGLVDGARRQGDVPRPHGRGVAGDRGPAGAQGRAEGADRPRARPLPAAGRAAHQCVRAR